MERILHVVNNMQRAGLETVIMNYYRRIDKTKFQFDFLTHRQEKSAYEDEIVDLGGKIYRMPRLYPQNYINYFKSMDLFFNLHPEYRIVHSHIDSMSYIPLLAAKKANVPIRIAHSHNAGIDLNWKYPMKEYYRRKIKSVSTDLFACGEKAGRYLFSTDDFYIMANAIDTKKFRYNPYIRKEVRRSLGIKENSIVLGAIGRLTNQKNHKFLIKAFADAIKENNNLELIIIGNGEKEKSLKRQVNVFGIEENVIFLKNQEQVERFYNAFDSFLLPSKYEGIPVVGVEAQAAGLPCIFSDAIADEVIFSKYVSKLPRKTGVWTENMILAKPSSERTIENFGEYDISSACLKLEKKYSQLLNRL